MRIKTRKT